MNRTVRLSTAALLCGALSFGALTGAHALWTADNGARLAPIMNGAVRFAAAPAGGAPTASIGGAPVEIAIPGDIIGAAIDVDPLLPEPIIWRFTASGPALGITGVTYDLAATAQRWSNGRTEAITAGAAAAGTVLAGSTLHVYPAGLGADCSAVPAAPEGDANVVVHAEHNELQAPRVAAGISHADTVTVIGTPVVPEVDRDGKPTGGPSLDKDGSPVPVRDDNGKPVRISDTDPFHAYAPGVLAVTGQTFAAGAVVLAGLLMMVLGAMAVLNRRRRDA